ncbi:hypothetical protein IM774_01940 [Erysipelotrichaceae bacterium RD49]|nr:hypothetical protein [Erysipelotrichaceae bacterium RD49]
MRKKHLFSLAAITAALCVPISPVLAISPLAPEQIPEHLSADQFVNLFGGTFDESSQSGYVIRQFVWFRQATFDNAALIIQGKEIFDTLDEATRQAIYAKYQAQQIDYDGLVQQAMDLLSPVEPAPAVVQEDRPIVQNVPQEQTPVQAPSNLPEPSTPANQPDAPVDQPAASEPVEPESPASQASNSSASSQQTVQPSAPEDQKEPQAVQPADSEGLPAAQSSAPEQSADTPADESHGMDLIYIQTLKPTEKEQTVLSALYALHTKPVAEDEDDLADIRPVDEADSQLASTQPVSENVVDLVRPHPVSEEESKNSSNPDTQAKENESNPANTNDQDETQPKDEPVQTINPGLPTIVNHPQNEADPDVIFLVEDRPEGLSFVDDLTPFDANTEKLIQALASKAGFTIFEAHPVTYTFEKDGLKASSQGLIKVSENCKPVLFQIQAVSDHDADIVFLSDTSCDIDASGVLNLKATGSMHLDFDQPVIDPSDPTEDAKPDEAANPAADSSLSEDEKARLDDQADKQAEAGIPVINPESDPAKQNLQTVVQNQPEPETQEETAVIAKLNPAEDKLVQTLDSPAVLPDFSGESTSASKDAAANDFINKYCLYNGSVIQSVDSSNYQILLGGASAWNALSNVSRTTVNSYLNNAGSTRWQLLYQQANRVRLGLAGSRTPSRTPATGVETNMLWYFALAGISGEVMIYCANKARKSKSKKSA